VAQAAESNSPQFAFLFSTIMASFNPEAKGNPTQRARKEATLQTAGGRIQQRH
jgi:hypothetical protein